MYKNLTFKLLCIVFIAFLFGCKSKSPLTQSQNTINVTGPQVVIYKTKDNYFMHVPVNLSADKLSLTYPVKLENGYLLDRRGINEGCAFLKLTYYEYSRLDHTPTQEELMNLILDPDPLTELYYCGRKNDFKDLESELNQAILSGNLDKFKRIR
jgi:hypothetical protein